MRKLSYRIVGSDITVDTLAEKKALEKKYPNLVIKAQVVECPRGKVRNNNDYKGVYHNAK